MVHHRASFSRKKKEQFGLEGDTRICILSCRFIGRVETALPHMPDKGASRKGNSKVSSFLNWNFWSLWNKLCQICCHLVWTLEYPYFAVLLGFIGGHDFALHGFVYSRRPSPTDISNNLKWRICKKSGINKIWLIYLLIQAIRFIWKQRVLIFGYIV